ncbi:MAG: biotin--[acetyl-CoA-carboxylase] ligase [Lachnospiraceae bacterium]|nr:biotin--[acetyl-CoA-carboxylase] ligase [Lachnospiraceae bacterium]
MAEKFGKNEIEKNLHCRVLKNEICFFDEIDSTNLEAIRRAEQGLVIVADKQNAGRGSHGRSWYSEKNVGIYLTFTLIGGIAPDLAFSLPILTALCISRAIDRIAGVNTMIKWPNDILLNGKKICGILAETDIKNNSLNSMVVGAGINVNNTVFPGDISSKASSVIMGSGELIDRNILCSEIINELDEAIFCFLQDRNLNRWIDTYNGRLIHYNRRIDILKGDKRECVCSKGINNKGQLQVVKMNGLEEYISLGEVSVRGDGIY